MIKCNSCDREFDDVLVKNTHTKYVRMEYPITTEEYWDVECGNGRKYYTNQFYMDLCGWCEINHIKAINLVRKYDDRLIVNVF